MRKTFLTIAIIAASITITVIACTNAGKTDHSETTTKDSVQLVKRGEYLVSIVGCDDCHSPKRMGANGPEIIPELRLSGYPSTRPPQKADSNIVKQGWALFGADLTSAAGPWGMSFSANLTSDATGIGNWKEAQFIKAIKEGKYKGLDGNRDLLPPMPWFVYRNMSDDDLRSIYAYLKTVKPVKNLVPAPKQFSEIN